MQKLRSFITHGRHARPLDVEFEHYKSIKNWGDRPIPALDKLSADESDEVLWVALRDHESIAYERLFYNINRKHVIRYHLSLTRKNSIGELWLSACEIHSLVDAMLEMSDGYYTPEMVALMCYVEGVNGGCHLWDAVQMGHWEKNEVPHNVGKCIIAIQDGTDWINDLYPPDRCFINFLHGVCLIEGWGMERDLYKAFVILHCIYDGWWQKKAREYLDDLRFMLPHRPLKF